MNKIILILIAVFMTIPVLSFAGGCMEASSDEGVNVVGYLQSQFEYQMNEDENESSFTFNRARMGLVGNIPYDFSYYIMFEYSAFKGGPYLLDGFITYSRLAPFASVSWGQFKSPFSLELNTPCQGLHTVRRSLVVNELTNPQRDMGLLFEGNYKEFASYAVSVTNGSEFGEVDNNENKMVSGRLVLSPVSFLNIGGSYKFSTVPPQVDGLDEDERTRFAGEIELDFENILVQAEYISAEDIGSYTTGGG
ncbi:MAG: porin [Candidatus Cloacimonadota bacterium]|nr:porin [Candidatus Cloacimonadota bacterium]